MQPTADQQIFNIAMDLLCQRDVSERDQQLYQSFLTISFSNGTHTIKVE